ncbi:MAG: IS630 family transposase [Prevotella sp.]|jgi:hypothetical protein|nr:IS630 family transposase [Prevotella sp.]
MLGYSWKRVRLSLKMFRDQDLFDKQKQEIEQLMILDKEDYIDLYFGDESHFGLTPNVPYAWQEKDNPILLPSKRAQRLSVFALMNPQSEIFYRMVDGTAKSMDIISTLDEFVLTITKKTIIVLDNAPIHHSKAFKYKIREWSRQDLFVYFLPPYSPELNKIEILWRFIKYRWLPFDAFFNFNNLKERLSLTLKNIGPKCCINFY